MRTRIKLAALLVCALCLSSCALLPEEETFESAPVIKSYEARSYKLACVTRDELIKSVRVTCAYVPVQSEKLAFAIGGEYIDEIFVSPGDSVQSGEVLGQLRLNGVEEKIESCRESLTSLEMQLRQLTERQALAEKKTRIQLDIYGQVDIEQIEWFEKLKSEFPNYIRYGGVVPFDKSVEILKKYFILVFPTLFYTEGIPGTIIDGYAAGLPVLSSRWESFHDVVDENKSGMGYEFGDRKALKDALLYCIENVEEINSLKMHSLEKSKEFTIECAMENLFSKLA